MLSLPPAAGPGGLVLRTDTAPEGAEDTTMRTQPTFWGMATTTTRQDDLFATAEVLGLHCCECGAGLVQTESMYLCCPNGHGKLLTEAPAEEPCGSWMEPDELDVGRWENEGGR